MTEEPLDWRIEQYGKMGFDHVQSVNLANEKQHEVWIPWQRVKKVLEQTGGDHDLTVRVFCGTPTDLGAILGAA